MRIVGSESPSLPPLDPLPPSENSWALQVESEEAAHFHIKEKLFHRDHWKERSWGSSKWADCGSRKASHESRDAETNANFKLSRSYNRDSHTTPSTRSTCAIECCDDSQRQERSLRENIRRRTYSPTQAMYCAHWKSRSSDFLEPVRKNENKISPPRSHRSHRCRSQAILYGSAMYTDTKVSEMANSSSHTSSRSSDNAHFRQSQRARQRGTQAARFSGDDRGSARHGGIQDVQLSDEKGDVRHGCRRRTRDVKLADNARFTNPSQPAGDERHGCTKWHNRRSSGDETFRGSKGIVYGEVENESNHGIDEFKLEARTYLDNCKQSRDEGCIQAAGIQAGSCIDKYANGELKESNEVSVLIDDKCRRYEGNEDHDIDARIGTSHESTSSKIKTKLASQLSKEVGALLMQQGFNKRTGLEGFDTNLSQSEECISNTLTEQRQDNLQENSSFSNIELEMSSRDDAEAKEDDSLDTEQQYKMLASLLLDDSLDIGQEFDVTLVPGEPDLEFCGSIFDDDFEIPVSGDVEDVACIKDTVSLKKEPVPDSRLVGLQEPHQCVMRSLFQDGKNIMEHQSVSRNKHVEERAVLRDTGFQPAEKQRSLQSSSEMKPSPRVFVDVTNKFEIHTPPVIKESQENDSHRLNQRQKQVEFGKNTLGYERYCELVPRCKRKPQDPQTPNPKQICSKRSWDGQIRKWRRLLHVYDLPNVDGEESAEDFSILKSREGQAAGLKRDNTRFSKSIEIKGYNVGEVKEDASLTIYDDWIVS